MSTPKATGYVRTIQRAAGPVYYAHIRTVDGRRLQPKLGPAWLKRSRPPQGHLTPAMAEAELAEILAGENPRRRRRPRPPARRSGTPRSSGCATSSTTASANTPPCRATAAPSSTA